MDILTKEQRHKNMSRIRSKDTRAERLLRQALWAERIHYRKNYGELPGKPDIVLTKYKIAIFVDGDFWHARGHKENPGEQVRTNQDFWQKKLKRNVKRDQKVDKALFEKGWLVLRFWESDIKKDLPGCVQKILSYIPLIGFFVL